MAEFDGDRERGLGGFWLQLLFHRADSDHCDTFCFSMYVGVADGMFQRLS